MCVLAWRYRWVSAEVKIHGGVACVGRYGKFHVHSLLDFRKQYFFLFKSKIIKLVIQMLLCSKLWMSQPWGDEAIL